ncbi:MAG TPA: ATP-binding protein, partial [Labilithrix sp.]|nr:ATP-binding protein [Labilithrix sp.]
SARELDRLSRSLEQLVAERTRALVAAEASLLKTEKMAALGQLAAGVAHEINNPAAAVEANLAYLRDALDAGGLPHDGRECLDESLEAVARIAKIVGKLLDAGRSATKDPASSGTASVQLAVEEAMMTSRPHVGEHITTTVDLSSALYVRADAPSLVQVLVNLIVNAAQAIPVERGHGHVQIRTSSTGGRIAIQVIDDGTGMSDETKRRLFEPFFTTKPMDEGTGLGLAVSLGLLRAMGGDLEVASAPGSTCMTILLDAEL